MDYYQILGIPRNASDGDIKSAFRKLALEYHPDRQAKESAARKAWAAQKFKAITEAYDVLGDAKKRAQYASPGNQAYGSRSHAPYRQYKYNPSSYNTHQYTASAGSPGIGAFYRFFSAVARNTTRGDAMFQAGMASAFLGSLLLAASSGEFLWGHHNQGKLFHHIENDIQARKPSESTVASEKPAPDTKRAGREHLRMDDEQYQQTIGVLAKTQKKAEADLEQPKEQSPVDPHVPKSSSLGQTASAGPENGPESSESLLAKASLEGQSEATPDSASVKRSADSSSREEENVSEPPSRTEGSVQSEDANQKGPVKIAAQPANMMSNPPAKDTSHDKSAGDKLQKSERKLDEIVAEDINDEEKQKRLNELAQTLSEDSLRNLSERDAETARAAKLEELNKTISKLREK